jgi:hypothetical protein
MSLLTVLVLYFTSNAYYGEPSWQLVPSLLLPTLLSAPPAP